MNTYPFYQVDAFTDQPLGGNPCAVIFDSGELDEATMLAIAREMNLSETAFVWQTESGNIAARYFTPAEEIPFAGHPTLAVAFSLVESGRLHLKDPLTRLTLELKIGGVEVDINAPGGKIERIMMTQHRPEFLEVLEPGLVLPVFGLQASDLLPGLPVQIVSTGTPQLMVPLRDLDALRRVQVNISAYQELRDSAGFFSPHLFCLQGISPVGRTFARHFGVPPDSPEDPFTGSATGGMAAYIWRYRSIDSPVFIAEQGHWMHRPGQAWVEVIGPPEDIEAVRVGGSAVCVLRGELSF